MDSRCQGLVMTALVLLCSWPSTTASSYDDLQKDLLFEQTLRVECQKDLQSKVAALEDLQHHSDALQTNLTRVKYDLAKKTHKMELNQIEMNHLSEEIQVLQGRLKDKDQRVSMLKREVETTKEELNFCNHNFLDDSECLRAKLALIDELEKIKFEKLSQDWEAERCKENFQLSLFGIVVLVIVGAVVSLILQRLYSYIRRKYGLYKRGRSYEEGDRSDIDNSHCEVRKEHNNVNNMSGINTAGLDRNGEVSDVTDLTNNRKVQTDTRDVLSDTRDNSSGLPGHPDVRQRPQTRQTTNLYPNLDNQDT